MELQEFIKESVTNEDVAKINKIVTNPLNNNDIFVFKARLCNNEIDREFEKMDHEFLESLLDKVVGTTVLKNHSWDVDDQIGRVYDAELIKDDTVKTIDDTPLEYILAKIFISSTNIDIIDKIKNGILKEGSISFSNELNTCSICGEQIDKSNITCKCKNGHILGHKYKDNLCYNKLGGFKDVMEWSLVAVPCQPDAGINNKQYNLGGSIMKKSEYLFKKLLNSKSLKEAPDDVKETLKEAIETEESKELDSEDISKLIEENSTLKDQVEALKSELEALKESGTRDKIKSIIDKALDTNLVVPSVKSLIAKEFDVDNMELDGDTVIGLDDKLKELKDTYVDLFKQETEDDKACKEVDDTVKVDDDTDDDTKVTVETKKLTRPSGRITFGSTCKSLENDRPTKKVGKAHLTY